MKQVIAQEALTRLLVEKGIFTEEEFLEMGRVVNQEIKRKKVASMTLLPKHGKAIRNEEIQR